MEVTGKDWGEDDIVTLVIAVVSLGDIGRMKSEKIYTELAKAMRKE
jgi:hypothetical protein